MPTLPTYLPTYLNLTLLRPELASVRGTDGRGVAWRCQAGEQGGGGVGAVVGTQGAAAWVGAERACRGMMRGKQRSSGPLPRRTPAPCAGRVAGAA